MDSITIDEVRIPATLEAPESDDFIRSMEVSNEVGAFEFGTDEMWFSASDALPEYLDSEYQPKRLFVARIDGQIVARAVYERISGEPDVAWMNIRVLPAFRNRRIGTRLADPMEQLGRKDHRARLVTYAVPRTRPAIESRRRPASDRCRWRKRKCNS